MTVEETQVFLPVIGDTFHFDCLCLQIFVLKGEEKLYILVFD